VHFSRDDNCLRRLRQVNFHVGFACDTNLLTRIFCSSSGCITPWSEPKHKVSRIFFLHFFGSWMLWPGPFGLRGCHPGRVHEVRGHFQECFL
jgi:hypothetical protein